MKRLVYPALRITLATLVILLVMSKFFFGAWWPGHMPGKSFSGDSAPLDAHQLALKERLFAHIHHLAEEIGERESLDGSLDLAADYLIAQFVEMGYQPELQAYAVHGGTARNIIVEVEGSAVPVEILVIGAHYDSHHGTPGANDNASGVAALLELARLSHARPGKRTVRFIAFANEEPPYFHTEKMGSHVYASEAFAKQENIVGMLSLETIGYYSAKPGSQKYPPPLGYFYPHTGNFVAFVGNRASQELLRDAIRLFRSAAQVPSEGGIAPESITGIDWSDHWSFWQFGYPAIMVTDTAVFRYPHYHMPTDTIDKIDFETLTRVVLGLEKVVAGLADGD